jgi:FkbM family methyltransferase
MQFNIDLFNEIATYHDQHSRTSKWWEESNRNYSTKFTEAFTSTVANFQIGSAGEIRIKNMTFGSINSSHLFGLDELIIFAWYDVNSQKYKKTLDLGANIGAHSLIMSKYGFEVTAYEPDPIHVKLFHETMMENSIKNIQLRKRAIGSKAGKSNFTRVLGNTTGSHLTGAKSNPYGDLEMFEVDVDDIKEVLTEGYDFIKMDVEGYEVKLISALKSEDFATMEMMLEIGTPENAFQIFEELKRLEINAFSQKTSWKKVEALDDLPTSHREGSLFLTSSSSMNWSSRKG